MLQNISLQPSLPELWGGLECTISRVGNEFRDQLRDVGHYTRAGDISAIASLNLRSIRYPVLWELHQPSEYWPIDWRWSESQLKAIVAEGMKPIVGLLNHGSGPAFTDLLDDQFPEKFSRYAAAVAHKFPFVDHYTPVNEPLTTARFSALYGHWYPHTKNPRCFAKALLNQLKGVVLAMKAIRSVNPNAQLVQTEDMGRVHSTHALKYQADFENERRWLTFDLLCGYVTKHHPMWYYLLSLGIEQRDLEFFSENTCAPDLLGLNYYVTSERYLDENIDAYNVPPGGNGISQYVDTEAVRVGVASGLRSLLREVWERYSLPIALTEVHLACTCDEQIRWFVEAWRACCDEIRDGMEIKAVTAWSLLGAHDWDSLLTKNRMNYESGAFDIRRGKLRMTDLGKTIATIGATGDFNHALLKTEGWWHMQEQVKVAS